MRMQDQETTVGTGQKSHFTALCLWIIDCAVTSVPMRFYTSGYNGQVIPRQCRRLIARTTWHRAWLSGIMGVYRQDGEFHGVCERSWTISRKPSRNASLTSVLKCLVAPWSRPIRFK